jgi:signal transduction histidine kinase
LRQRLIWKLLLVNILPVIAIVVFVIWLAIDHLAADYFMTLMNKYEVSPTETHQMFLAAVHRYMIWATVAGLGLALLLSYLLIRRVLRPLSQMAEISRDYAAGNFERRVAVTSSDEVGQLGLAFNGMADSLDRLERLRKTMVADVAHELRTPLTNLRGYYEALSDEVIPPDEETLAMLQAEFLRLVQLVEDLGQLARADAARAFLDKREIDLHQAIEQMVELYRPKFQVKNIAVDINLPAETRQVPADRDKLLPAIRNLVENCWKYTPEDGGVSIEADRRETSIRVTFSNSGPGIDRQDLPYVFERFYRGDRSRSRDAGGAGIGLSIVKELITAHGGEVGAESSNEKTSFWFELPL